MADAQNTPAYHAELCRADAPDKLQGQRLVPMLTNPSVKGRGWALTQIGHGTVIRKGCVQPRSVLCGSVRISE